MEIQYDITDWKNHYDASDARPASIDEAIGLMLESDIKPSEAALLLIVGRELGLVKDPNLPTNKISNLLGVSQRISQYRAKQVAEVRIAGKTTTVPRYVSTVTVDEGEEVAYQAQAPSIQPATTVVDHNTQAAADRATAYLMTNVVGHIRDRLKLVALNRPDAVRGIVKELKAAIDEIVKDLG